MKIPYFHVDAFTSQVFTGNPAGVCMLEQWLDDEVMQAIAAENKHSETAFIVSPDGHYQLRWFTPKVEIDLCGHATLASAHVLFSHEGIEGHEVSFESKSGVLTVKKQDDILEMDFPSRPLAACEVPEGIGRIMGHSPKEALCARDLILVYEDEQQIRELSPDFNALMAVEHFIVMATAPGSETDFVSRCFAPRAGIPEDPVTGSAHCSLIPYWSGRLGKMQMNAHQLSERGGQLICADRGNRVGIGGRAVTYMTGEIVVRP